MSDWRTNAELDMDIRVEQVRLVFISMKNSLYLGIALALVLVLALYSADNSVHLLIWFALVAGEVLHGRSRAPHFKARPCRVLRSRGQIPYAQPAQYGPPDRTPFESAP